MFAEALAQRILDVGTQFYAEWAHKIPAFVGIPEVLKQLQADCYVLGLVSSKRRVHVIRELVSKGLRSFFDVIVAQEDTIRNQPDPAPLLLAASHLGASSEDCVYIGDQPTDILAASAAGMRSVAALWGDGRVPRFETAPPTAVAYAPSDIVATLSQMARTR